MCLKMREPLPLVAYHYRYTWLDSLALQKQMVDSGRIAGQITGSAIP